MPHKDSYTPTGSTRRIHHFRRETSLGWPRNSLPIDPAARALSIEPADLLEVQVFQIACCNWRCWYCYVPVSLLGADSSHATWLSAANLIDLYLQEPLRPNVIDLSGGQPDLVPEWILWMMQELLARGMQNEVYLWSDDNLSTDFFWRFLSQEDREFIASYQNYGKVCCFKGFTAESFAFNTLAAPELFQRQFELMHRYVDFGIDLYGYVTFTTPSRNGIDDDMERFVDSLQGIHPNLPLRVVPLEIRDFTPMAERVNQSHREALQNQKAVAVAWQAALERRFTAPERMSNIVDVPIGKRSSSIP
jgi:uncharacterized Fe-S cluster-containing radical SAM superfamily protein